MVGHCVRPTMIAVSSATYPPAAQMEIVSRVTTAAREPIAPIWESRAEASIAIARARRVVASAHVEAMATAKSASLCAAVSELIVDLHCQRRRLHGRRPGV